MFWKLKLRTSHILSYKDIPLGRMKATSLYLSVGTDDTPGLPQSLNLVKSERGDETDMCLSDLASLGWSPFGAAEDTDTDDPSMMKSTFLKSMNSVFNTKTKTHLISSFTTFILLKVIKANDRNGFGINTSKISAFGSIFFASSVKNSRRILSDIFSCSLPTNNLAASIPVNSPPSAAVF